MTFSRTITVSVIVDGSLQSSSIGVYNDTVEFGFDSDYPVGTYWNGDPWVQRPSRGDVRITSMSPAGLGNGSIAASLGADRVRNGAMLNWNTGAEAALDQGLINGAGEGFQAFDSHQPSVDFQGYLDTKQVDPTLTGSHLVISAEGAVLKAVSEPDENIGPGNLTRGDVLSDVGLLTIVDQTPPANAFRPGAHTLNKAHRWTTADVDYSLVPSGLTSPASTPSYSVASLKVLRHHLMGTLQYNASRVLMPQKHMWNYGMNNAKAMTEAVLWAMTDTATTEQRETILNSIVQIGIDVYDRYNEGGRWHPNGGLYRGYKFPLVISATLLDDAGMKAVAQVNPTTAASGGDVSDAFGDDRSIWYLTSSDTGRSVEAGNDRYIASDEGDPEWGEQHTEQDTRDDRRENATYRDINHRGIIGAALACQMVTGARANWNWQAHFDYADRVMERDFFASGEALTYGGGTNWAADYSGANDIPQFQRDMWSNHRASYGGAVWNR